MSGSVAMGRICMICQDTVKEQKHWINCPKFESGICMRHCFGGCKHRKDDYCTYKIRRK